MRHIALVDPQTLKVVNVIDLPDNLGKFKDVQDFCAGLGLTQLAHETFMDEDPKPQGALKNYAAIGHALDTKNGGFIAPKPETIPNAVIDSKALKWVDPDKNPDVVPLTDSVALGNASANQEGK